MQLLRLQFASVAISSSPLVDLHEGVARGRENSETCEVTFVPLEEDLKLGDVVKVVVEASKHNSRK